MSLVTWETTVQSLSALMDALMANVLGLMFVNVRLDGMEAVVNNVNRQKTVKTPTMTTERRDVDARHHAEAKTQIRTV